VLKFLTEVECLCAFNLIRTKA